MDIGLWMIIVAVVLCVIIVGTINYKKGRGFWY
jgi:hypothetical protein